MDLWGEIKGYLCQKSHVRGNSIEYYLPGIFEVVKMHVFKVVGQRQISYNEFHCQQSVVCSCREPASKLLMIQWLKK